jgi:hypothetical protein
MTENEQRLQRHVRAMAVMNRQLQAQLEGGRTWAPSSGPGNGDLLTGPVGTSGAIVGGVRRAGAADAWLEQLAVSGEGPKPFLVRLPNGKPFLVEGGYRREVPSALLVSTLERVFGACHTVSADEAKRWTDGVPVVVMEGPQGPPFVVVSGKRRSLRGLPMPYPVSPEQMRLLPAGRDLNVAEANVSRAKFERAMYGGYQVDRVRSAIRRKGLVGTTKAAANRFSRRARRAIRARRSG